MRKLISLGLALACLPLLAGCLPDKGPPPANPPAPAPGDPKPRTPAPELQWNARWAKALSKNATEDVAVIVSGRLTTIFSYHVNDAHGKLPDDGSTVTVTVAVKYARYHSCQITRRGIPIGNGTQFTDGPGPVQCKVGP